MERHHSHLILSILGAVVLLAGIYIFTNTSAIPVALESLPPQTQTAAVSDFNSNLIAHYTFDEGTGTTAADSVGSYEGTLIGGAEWATDGVIGGAIKLSGGTMAVSSASDPIGTGAVTVSAWIKPASTSFLHVIVSNNSNGFSFRLANSFKRLECTNGGGTMAYSANNSISLNVWHFVTAVRDSSGTCTMYINGVQSGSANQNAGTITGSVGGFFIGRRPAVAYPFDGLIDDVRVYNTALSAPQIMELYTGGGGVPAPVLHTLSVSKTGSGSVSSSPAGISCGSSCSTSMNEGTAVTLTATPSSGSTFSGWGGGSCTGTGTCSFALNTDTAITATFTSDNPPIITGTTVNAVDCSQLRVQQAIDLASDGMTVIVPAGTCTWIPVGTTGGAVNMSNKSIVLRGAGIGATNIILSNAPEYNQSALAISMSTDKPFRVTGFTFSGDGKQAYVVVYGNSKGFRIDHVSNRADTPSATRLIAVIGHTYGVIDHVETNSHQNNGSGMILIRGEDGTARMTGNTAWKRSLSLGSPQAVYIEDSTFNGAVAGFTSFATDIENGGALVFRHNQVTNLEFGSHGAQSSGGRGAMVWEIYNNTFNLNHKVYSVMAWLRGGTGVIFDNTFVRTNGGYGYYIAFDNPRAHTAYVTFGSKCDGTNAWDGNEDATGYPCLDQIGRSAGDPGHQLLAPAYEWNNKTQTGEDIDVAVINPPSDRQIKDGRDYFSDQQYPGYVPYIYPHPLVVSGFTSDGGGDLPPPGTTCTSFTYSSWGICTNGSQSRTVTSSSPAGCTGGTPVLTQSCTITPIAGDFNHDGLVNSLDSSALFSAWNQSNATYDLNADGIVNSLDYVIMVKNWTV